MSLDFHRCMPCDTLCSSVCNLQTNCDIPLPEFELQTIIGNNYLKLNGEDASAMAKRVAACDNADIRPVRVKGVRRAWNAPGVKAKAIKVKTHNFVTIDKLVGSVRGRMAAVVDNDITRYHHRWCHQGNNTWTCHCCGLQGNTRTGRHKVRCMCMCIHSDQEDTSIEWMISSWSPTAGLLLLLSYELLLIYLQDNSFATSAFGRKPTFLGATLAGDEVVATGVVYKVTEEQYNKQVRAVMVSAVGPLAVYATF
jgi:hypothetical protein